MVKLLCCMIGGALGLLATPAEAGTVYLYQTGNIERTVTVDVSVSNAMVYDFIQGKESGADIQYPEDVIFVCDDDRAFLELGTQDLLSIGTYWKYTIRLVLTTDDVLSTVCHAYYDGIERYTLNVTTIE